MRFTLSSPKPTEKASSDRSGLTVDLHVSLSSLKRRKRAEKASSDSAWLSFDLVSQLTYMAALAASFSTRDTIFEKAITQSYKTAIYFRQVYLLTKRLGFEYSRAFQLVAKKAGAETVKALLLRFASSISSGESELGFLTQEARVEREIYTADYLRRLDTLQKWTDAYAALTVSITVIVVVVMVSTMLYDMGTGFNTVIALMSVFMSFSGAYVIYKSAPYEIKTYSSGKGPTFRRWAVYLSVAGFPFAVLGAALGLRFGPGQAFLIFGIALLPGGILAFMDDSRVSKLDQEVAGFIRATGNIAAALGTTISIAVSRLDRRSMGQLEPYIKRLQTRLESHLNPTICWERFRDEVGSELVNRSTRMLVDGADLGASPERVGEIAADYALGIALLRAKRQVASSTFAYLSIPLHGAIISLLVFILEVMRAFNVRLMEALAEMTERAAASSSGSTMQMPELPVFQRQDLTFTSNITMAVIIGLTVVNAATPVFATGGHRVKGVFYASVMCIISGLSLIGIPVIARGFLMR